LATLTRELNEELGVTLVGSEPLGLVSDQAALEPTPMEMDVYLVTVSGRATPQAEIQALAWVGASGTSRGILAPAVRNYVLPQLIAQGLIA
jgi:8-oxo-dGTP diphosphatase